MTVAQLITALQQMPPDALAVIEYDGQYNDASVKAVEIVTNSPDAPLWADHLAMSKYRTLKDGEVVIAAVCVGCGGD